jgi:putative AlgH/UPF0301 family transcriptional regulator
VPLGEEEVAICCRHSSKGALGVNRNKRSTRRKEEQVVENGVKMTEIDEFFVKPEAKKAESEVERCFRLW